MGHHLLQTVDYQPDRAGLNHRPGKPLFANKGRVDRDFLGLTGGGNLTAGNRSGAVERSFQVTNLFGDR